MDRKLPDTATSYAVDQEVDDSNDDWRYSGVNKDPIDPATFHALRVTGMALLLVTIFLSFVLVKISSRRKEERELDIAEAKMERGGLVTEEGLDLMLDIGRRESYKVGLSASTGKVLKSSRSCAQGDSDDSNLRYLPSTLNPAKNDVGVRSLVTKGRVNEA